MNVALVYDKVNKFGGAERILLALHEIWPDASLYTSVYDEKQAKWAGDFKIESSFLQNLPGVLKRDVLLPLFSPFAFESFNFDKYDVVISVTSAEGKAIITKPDTLHISYCLTPTRYLWSGYEYYYSQPGAGNLNPLLRWIMKLYFPHLRRWDFLISNRPDYYIAISKTVALRIQKYYRKTSEVIYPPLDLNIFKPENSTTSSDYYLVVSRLVAYKRIDYVISAFNNLGWKLKIIGKGIEEDRLKRSAMRNIEFLGGNLTDEKVSCYYQHCQALIFPGEEDFGLTAVEAQACGRPVIAYSLGGVKETVIPGITGELYNEQTAEALIGALKKFKEGRYSRKACMNNVRRYSKTNFQSKMKQTIKRYFLEHNKKI